MAKKGLLESNERKAKLMKRDAAKRNALKAEIKNVKLPLEERFLASMKLAALPRNGSRTRIRTRCVLTGRPRSVYRFCGLSRIALRELAVTGQLPGVRRSSW